MRPHYCCGGIGGRDDGGAVGDRDEGGGTVDLCAAAAGGCDGGSGIFISISTTDLNTKSNYQDFQRFPDLDLSMAADSEATLPALIEACRRLLTGDRKSALEERAKKLGEAQQEARQRMLTEASYAWDASPISLARIAAAVAQAAAGGPSSTAATDTFTVAVPTAPAAPTIASPANGSTDATTAKPEKLFAELRHADWSRREAANVEILRRGGDLLVHATKRLQDAKEVRVTYFVAIGL